MDMKLGIVVIPVADVGRAKNFHGGLGWREDADLATGGDCRMVRFTPPGSARPVIFDSGPVSAAPGSPQGLQLTAAKEQAGNSGPADRSAGT